jgi:hypothetical protein
MDWETVKLPPGVTANDVDRLMTNRKKILQQWNAANMKNGGGGSGGKYLNNLPIFITY